MSGNAIEMRHYVVLARWQTCEFVLAVVVGVHGAFQLKNRDDQTL